MKLNGKNIKLNNTKNLELLLKEYGYNSERTVVELNGEIISKTKYKTTEISDDDKVEVLSFVGGG